MSYVLEEIPEEAYEKYDIEEGVSSYWAIDKERDVWFREYLEHIDREDNPGEYVCTYWHLYWKNTLIRWIRTVFVKKKFTVENGEYYAHMKITEIKIPEEIKEYEEEILKEIKIGLETLNIDIGIDDETKSCRVDLEYKGRLI